MIALGKRLYVFMLETKYKARAIDQVTNLQELEQEFQLQQIRVDDMTNICVDDVRNICDLLARSFCHP